MTAAANRPFETRRIVISSAVFVGPTYHAFSCAAGSGCQPTDTRNREAQGAEAPSHERAASAATRSWAAGIRARRMILRLQSSRLHRFERTSQAEIQRMIGNSRKN